MYNARNYDTEVAETLLHKFYVGDPLKSLESKEIAIQLIKVIRKMCGEGGFKVSSKVVFQSIPECHQRSGVKNTDLDDSLPVERALGIY